MRVSCILNKRKEERRKGKETQLQTMTLNDVFLISLQVEGTFRVNTPPVLLGYHKRGRHSGAPSDLGIISRNDTLLTLFVTIEPPLQPSQPMAERVTLIVFCLIFKSAQTVMSVSLILPL